MRTTRPCGDTEEVHEEMADIHRSGRGTRDSLEIPLSIPLSRRGTSCSSLREAFEGARIRSSTMARRENYEKVKSIAVPTNDITTTQKKSHATRNDTALTDWNSL